MKTNTIHVFAKWQIKEGQVQAVLDLLPELINETKKEEGNLFYQVYQSHTDTHTLILFEGYASEHALDMHRCAPHFKEIVIKQIVPLLEKREVELSTEIF